MNSFRIYCFCVLLMFVGFIDLRAQQADTAAINLDSIEREVDAFIAMMDSLKKPTSYFQAGVGLGNQQFSSNNIALNAQQNNQPATCVPQLSYMHRSGLGLTYTGYLMPSKGSLQLLQHSITPSYDYVKSEQWISGISYTRFLGNQSLETGSSPYKNDWYAYAMRSKGWVQPSVSFGYSNGRFSETSQTDTFAVIKRLNRPDTTVAFRLFDTLRIRIRDFSMILSAQHRFKWKGITSKDYFTLTPSVLFFFARNRYDLEYVSEGKFSPRIQSLQKNNPLLFRQFETQVQRQFAGLLQTRNLLNDSKFALQSLGLNINFIWYIRKFFFNPKVYMDYYLLSSREKFKVFYSAQVGCIF